MTSRESLSGFYFISVILLSTVNLANGLDLKARVNSKGVKGTIVFSQNSPGTLTTVTTTLTGLGSASGWEFRELPVQYDVSDVCSNLGAKYTSIQGTVTGGSGGSIPGGDLHNVAILLGRSIVLTANGNRVACGTIESDGDHVTAVARVTSKVAGDIVFRQLSTDPSAPTSVYANLYKVDGSALESLKWKIDTKSITPSDSIATRCQSLVEVFNPKSVTDAGCSTASNENCKVGDLTGKLSEISAGAKKGTSIKSFLDMNLPLSSANSVIGKLLVLMTSSNETVTCAKITKLSTRQAKVVYSQDNVMGTIEMSQKSPWDPTNVQIKLDGLNSMAKDFTVRMYPVKSKMSAADNPCTATGSLYDPLAVGSFQNRVTSDQFKIGDLSGKYGDLDGQTSKTGQFMDWSLPLFGVNSVIGRSIAIHKKSDGSNWVCATIEPVAADIKRAVAEFLEPVIGRIYLQQPYTDEELSDTQVFAELDYLNGVSQTVNHNWHVHVKKIDFKKDKSEWCTSVGGHYNPLSVDLTGDYATECKESNQLRCESGDLSGKHGKVSVRESSGGMKSAFFTDIDLQLEGANSVASRSIVIHAANAGAGRLACADLMTVPMRTGKVSTWYSGDKTNNVQGSTSFAEKQVKFLTGITGVSFDLNGLASSASGIHVHLYPIDMAAVDSKKCSSAGGHFNPFSISSSPVNQSNDKYEVGDLSGKYGKPLDGNDRINSMFSDSNLPVSGPLGIIGRSIVIHKTGGERWVCGDIMDDTAGATLYKAKAVFTGDIIGEIHLSQYQYTSGGLSDTTITLNLKYAADNNKKTMNHNWHTHVSPIDTPGDCAAAGPHFNPFNANVSSTGYSECSPTNPLRCELGDQSKKVGQYSIGDGRRFFTDVYLPLVGHFGVIGRSIVVHAENGGAPRIACADIMPITNNVVSMPFPIMDNFAKSPMVKAIAEALHTETSNLAAQKTNEEVSPECMMVKMYITGKDAAIIKKSLQDMVDSNDSKLGRYKPSTCSSGMQNDPLNIGASAPERAHPILQLPSRWEY